MTEAHPFCLSLPALRSAGALVGAAPLAAGAAAAPGLPQRGQHEQRAARPAASDGLALLLLLDLWLASRASVASPWAARNALCRNPNTHHRRVLQTLRAVGYVPVADKRSRLPSVNGPSTLKTDPCFLCQPALSSD